MSGVLVGGRWMLVLLGAGRHCRGGQNHGRRETSGGEQGT